MTDKELNQAISDLRHRPATVACRNCGHGVPVGTAIRDWTGDETANAVLLDEILGPINTPELISLCGEDQWITVQRNLYNYLQRRWDADVSLAALRRRYIAETWLKWRRSNKNGKQ